VLNGSKAFTTNGNRANLALVYAITDPAEGQRAAEAFRAKYRAKNVTRYYPATDVAVEVSAAEPRPEPST